MPLTRNADPTGRPPVPAPPDPAGRRGSSRSSRSSSLLPALAGGWSGLAILLGLWWWATGNYPFGPADPQGDDTPLGALPGSVGPLVLVAAGVAAMLVAAFAVVRARRVAAGQPVGVVGTALVVATAVLYGVAFLLLAPGLSLLVLAGYLMAALGPVVLLAVLLAGARSSRTAAVVAGVLVLVGVVAWASGVADAGVLGEWAPALGQGLVRAAPRMLALIFLAAGGALWIAVGWTALRATPGGAAPDWARPEQAARWGRVATIVATLCALPYTLIRATWLTPWPLGIPGNGEALTGAMRLQGLLLGGAALAGAVLTTGLVARWGEVWPRWMPGLRGRPVPVAAAVVPATLVTLLLCSAAVPMALMTVGTGELWLQLVFPLPVWGPALGAATLAYALRRRGERERPGPIDPPGILEGP